MSGRAFSYFADTPGLPLSLKCMSNGRALYKFGRAEVAVDDGGYLILNDRQPYSIEIASPTPVETFVLWFPRGWAEEVFRGFNETPETLLANSPDESGARASFFARYTPHDESSRPKCTLCARRSKARKTIQDGWLEEKLRNYLRQCSPASARSNAGRHLPAARASTREELWRRVNHARDYLHAHLRHQSHCRCRRRGVSVAVLICSEFFGARSVRRRINISIIAEWNGRNFFSRKQQSR